MTPKEEAKELVDKFLPFVDWNDLQDDCTNRDWAIRNAKKCALIAVKMVILNCYEEEEYYWQEVKQEIENYGK